ncbi:MAG: hypothetical protein HY704_03425 [Gemmatimonadetes bacterium]|nr:hypothetical protein [Gemmatimonadota bacterium]
MRRAQTILALSVPPVLLLGGCARGERDGGPSAEAALATITADEIREQLRYLSSDSLAGREPASPGGELAAEYIAARFQEMGLEPVDGSYYQPMPIVGITADSASVTLAFSRGAWARSATSWASMPAAGPQSSG